MLNGDPSSRDNRMALGGISEDGFTRLVERHRQELHVHCYRLMGTLQDAEDMVQETFLRAWHRRETYEGRASIRAWLYKISTNACLDALRRRPKRYIPITRHGASSISEPIPGDLREPIWLEPYPDHWLQFEGPGPEDRVALHERITLAFIAALHLLPPRQRAALILCDVLDWQASEAATFLDTTVAAIKSALHRARTTLSTHIHHTDVSSDRISDDMLQAQLLSYMRAWETADIDALISLLRNDASFSMPPIPSWYQGKETIRELVSMTVFSGDAYGRWHLAPTGANRQPAFGLYRYSQSDGFYVAYGIQVLTVDMGLIADIITFRVPNLFHHFNLPEIIEQEPA